MNHESKIERQQRLCKLHLETLYNEKGIKLYFNDKGANLEYFPNKGMYAGYCSRTETNFFIKVETLMEYAATAKTELDLMASLRRAGELSVYVEGDARISIDASISNILISHFWDNYKALTG